MEPQDSLPSGAETRKRAGREETKRRRIRTVVVDDSAIIVGSLESFFRQQDGFEVVGTAGTGLEAIERVARLRPDLVVMDIRMPEMDGLEATRWIKAREGAPVVIMFTLEDSADARAAAKDAGADGFVAKGPEMVRELGAAMRRVFPGVSVRRGR